MFEVHLDCALDCALVVALCAFLDMFLIFAAGARESWCFGGWKSTFRGRCRTDVVLQLADIVCFGCLACSDFVAGAVSREL